MPATRNDSNRNTGSASCSCQSWNEGCCFPWNSVSQGELNDLLELVEEERLREIADDKSIGRARSARHRRCCNKIRKRARREGWDASGRMLRISSNPSMSGSFTSAKTRSKGCCSRTLTAALAFVTAVP